MGHTRIQKVFIRKVPLRFYAKRKFCVCFEVHILVMIPDDLDSKKRILGQSETLSSSISTLLNYHVFKVINFKKS